MMTGMDIDQNIPKSLLEGAQDALPDFDFLFLVFYVPAPQRNHTPNSLGEEKRVRSQ